MIKNIIFDWSGVINDNLDDLHRTVCDMFVSFGGKPITMEEMRKEWEQPYMVFYRKYFPDLTIEEEVAAYKKYYTKHHRQNIYPGMAKTLKKLKANNIKMAILSSDHPEHLFSDIEKYKLKGVFDRVYCDIHDKAEYLPNILKENSFEKNETIFIGDTAHEIDAGKNAGILTGAVTWGVHSIERLRKEKPDYIFENLAQLEEINLN